MDEIVGGVFGSVGIVIEILGFLFILWFWRIPTYSALNKWMQFEKICKIFLGKKRYERRISDKINYINGEAEIGPVIRVTDGPPMVPRVFVPFWNRMKWLGFILVIVGLAS